MGGTRVHTMLPHQGALFHGTQGPLRVLPPSLPRTHAVAEGAEELGLADDLAAQHAVDVRARDLNLKEGFAGGPK